MRRAPVSVCILATPNTSPSTLFGLSDVLGSVGSAWETFVTGKTGQPLFDVKIVAEDRKTFRCAQGVIVSPECSIADVDRTDIVIVASFVMPASEFPVSNNKVVLDWIVKQYNSGATLSSACTGAVLLAETGLLDGCNATTHWAYRDMFRRCFPKVQLKLEQGLCVSGEDSRIVTAGGTTSWQELVLYLTARYFSTEDASNTAKFWRLYNQERNQAAYMAIPQGMPHGDAVIEDCQKWIKEHYAVTNPVSEMIKISKLSQKTFARRFKRATGDRPMDYVHALRVDMAKELLEKDNHVVDMVGFEVGYEDPASFRRIFKRRVGMTPGIYRRRFSQSRFENLA